MLEKTKSLCWEYKGNKLDNNQNSAWPNTEKHYCSLVQPVRGRFSNPHTQQMIRFLGEANREI